MKNYPMNFRRYRQSGPLRDLMSTVSLSSQHLIQPYFVYEGLPETAELKGIQGQVKHTEASLIKAVENNLKDGLKSILLFVIPQKKQEKDFLFDFDTKVIRSLKEKFGHNLILFTDLCLCSNTLTGHCGIEGQHGFIENGATVNILAQKALQYAQAGADVISPSDMMDDRILAIREQLDRGNLHKTLIMSYSSKFSSQFYGPFREAAESTPSFGDRKSYQIDPRNLNDALRSSERDADQGADIIMVKPGGYYLDILLRLKQNTKTQHLPLCAYQVSGEFQALWLLHQAGYLQFPLAYYESLVALKRAGSDLIITYGANQFQRLFGQF